VSEGEKVWKRTKISTLIVAIALINGNPPSVS
jgi:hypothetical protein